MNKGGGSHCTADRREVERQDEEKKMFLEYSLAFLFHFVLWVCEALRRGRIEGASE